MRDGRLQKKIPRAETLRAQSCAENSAWCIREVVLCSRLGVELVGWHVVVAIEFQVVEGCGDAEPARHGRGFKACDSGFADDDDVSAAHGAADQDDFQFDLSTESQFARAKEKDTAGTDIARHEGDGKIFGVASDSAEPEREPKRGSGIFALLGKNADG